MNTYRVAVVGCRSRGSSIAQAYHRHPRTELVGLCDTIEERADALSAAVGSVAGFTDLHRMIGQTEPDIVVIATGTEFHYQLCLEVLEHGPINIDLEKPMAVDLEQADEMLKKAEELGSKIAVHHQTRSGPPMSALVKALGKGQIGRPRSIRASGKGYYGGLGLMNIGCHVINAMLEVAGHCRGLVAGSLANGRPITPEDVLPSPLGMGTIAGEHITALLEFGEGVTASLEQHRFAVVDATAMGFELLGDEGRLFWHQSGCFHYPRPHLLPGDSGWRSLDLDLPAGIESKAVDEYCYVDDYVNALDSGGQHRSSGFEALHVVEIMMGIFESSAYGRAVQLPQKARDHPLLRWRKEAGLPEPGELPRPYDEWLERVL